MSCIYITQSDCSGFDIIADREPTINNPFFKCFKLSSWKPSEVFVLDGVIVEISDCENRRIRFGSVFLEEQKMTYEYMDSHDHGIHTETRYAKFRFYLMVFKNHEYLKSIVD